MWPVDSRAQASLLAGAIVDSGARHCRIYLRTGCGELDRQRLEGLTEALEEARVVTDTAILGSGSLDWEPGIAAVALDAGTLGGLGRKATGGSPSVRNGCQRLGAGAFGSRPYLRLGGGE